MSDIQAFAQFYLTTLLLGISVWPLSKWMFSKFADAGWVFSKIMGIGFVSYVVWFLAITKIAPFTYTNTLLIACVIGLISWTGGLLYVNKHNKTFFKNIPWRMMLITELLFIVTLGGWALVRAYNPNIHGLEKFMDYGFMLSILRAEYFPPVDHYFASEPINYYYYGHHIAAVLTRLSAVPANFSYNLQIAQLFALSFVGSFSIVSTLLYRAFKNLSRTIIVMGGILGGILTAFTGNLHTILNVTELDSYWYATASRLIPYTINEFPLYSFIVADLHAHVSNIPTTLLSLGLLINLALSKVTQSTRLFVFNPIGSLTLVLLSMAIGASYATNSWDFPIYLIMSGCVFLYITWQQYKNSFTGSELWWSILRDTTIVSIILLILSVLFFAPFWLTVKPISDGIGIVHTLSPLKEFLMLWGMYIFVAGSFVFFYYRDRLGNGLKLSNIKRSVVTIFAKILGVKMHIDPTKNNISTEKNNLPTDQLTLIMLGVAALLLVLPEIIYVKDIYTPDYYRANTMFKLYYAAWIIGSVATAYGFMRMVYAVKKESLSVLWRLDVIFCYLLIAATLLYPYISVKTVTDSLKEYKGLDGTAYLETQMTEDAAAIEWINANVTDQPVILEAVGDSYTDYARVAANTGLPTVMGWPVHEWLWRGSYSDPVQPPSYVLTEFEADTVAQRVDEVREIYTTIDKTRLEFLLQKYNVSYIYIGKLEFDKYGSISELLNSDDFDIVYQDEYVRILSVTE